MYSGRSFLKEELLAKALAQVIKPFCLFSCYIQNRDLVCEINNNTFLLINSNSMNDLYDTIKANSNNNVIFFSLPMVTISCEIPGPQK